MRKCKREPVHTESSGVKKAPGRTGIFRGDAPGGRAAELLGRLGDRLTGPEGAFESRLERLYGKKDRKEYIAGLRRKNRNAYALAAALSVIVIAASGVSGHQPQAATSAGELNGELRIERPADGAAQISARARILSGGGIAAEKQYTITVRARGDDTAEGAYEAKSPEDEESEERTLVEEADRLVRMVGRSSESEYAVLPAELESGAGIVWTIEEEKDPPAGILLAAVLFVFVYSRRFETLKKQEREARESVILELPVFMNKLVLLLNAGLVMSEAFRLAASGSGNSYFCERMKEIQLRAEMTNEPVMRAFSVFAASSGVREFMRLANIINDNVDKGSELTDKLEAESRLLWEARKKAAEEKGRVAETKLTLPLMILLMSLVLITIAPAMLDM